jgi:hypothetical protein
MNSGDTPAVPDTVDEREPPHERRRLRYDRPRRPTQEERVEMRRAREEIERRLAWFGNDRVRVGPTTMVAEHVVELDLVDRADALLLRIRLDCRTGRLRPTDSAALARLLVPATVANQAPASSRQGRGRSASLAGGALKADLSFENAGGPSGTGIESPIPR